MEHPLLKPEIVNLVVIKTKELGQTLTYEQAKAAIEALVWMQQKLMERKS